MVEDYPNNIQEFLKHFKMIEIVGIIYLKFVGLMGFIVQNVMGKTII